MDILWLNVFNTGEIDWKLTTGKNHLLSNCCIAMKKRSRVFTIFPGTFFYFSRPFPSVTGYGFNWQPCKWQLELRLLPLNMPWHCHGSTIIFCTVLLGVNLLGKTTAHSWLLSVTQKTTFNQALKCMTENIFLQKKNNNKYIIKW